MRDKIKYVKSLMYKEKVLSQETFNRCYGILINLIPMEEKNENRVEITYAKLLYLLGKYSNSIYYFNKALEKKICFQCYYGLYKNYLILENYKKAYEMYMKYLDLNPYVKKNPESFNLIPALLSYLLDYECRYEICYGTLFNINLKNDKLDEFYTKLIDNVAIKNFYKASNYAKIMQDYLQDKNNICLEFETLHILLKACYSKYYVENLRRARKRLIVAKKNKDYALMYDIIKMYAYNNHLNINLYEYLVLLIENGYVEEVEDLLPYIHLRYKNIIKDIIKGKRDLEELNEEQKNWYNDYISIIEEALEEDELEYAYDMIEAVYYETEANIFLYYLGYILFLKEEYRSAIEYFDAYLKEDSSKKLEALFFRACAYNNIDATLKLKRESYSQFKTYKNLIGDTQNFALDDYSYEPQLALKK